MGVTVSDGFAETSDVIAIESNAAASLAVVGGDAQTGTVDTALGSPVVIEATNSCGALIEGAWIQWEGDNVQPLRSQAFSNGQGRISKQVKLGTDAGTATLTATAASGSAASFSFVAQPDSPAFLTARAPATATVSDSQGVAVTFTLTDVFGNPTASHDVTFDARLLDRTKAPPRAEFDAVGSGVRQKTGVSTSNGTATLTIYDTTKEVVYLLAENIDDTAIDFRAVVPLLDDGFESASAQWTLWSQTVSSNTSHWSWAGGIGHLQIGVPTSGPAAASSGSHALATNLDGSFNWPGGLAIRPLEVDLSERPLGDLYEVTLEAEHYVDIPIDASRDCAWAHGRLAVGNIEPSYDQGARYFPLVREWTRPLCDGGTRGLAGQIGDGGYTPLETTLDIGGQPTGDVALEQLGVFFDVARDQFAVEFGPGWYLDDLRVRASLSHGSIAFEPESPAQTSTEIVQHGVASSQDARVRITVFDIYGNPVGAGTLVELAVDKSARITNALKGGNFQTSGQAASVETNEAGLVEVSLSDSVAETVTVDASLTGVSGSVSSAQPVFTGGPEADCADGLDDDGDGRTDCDDANCDSASACYPALCTNTVDSVSLGLGVEFFKEYQYDTDYGAEVCGQTSEPETFVEMTFTEAGEYEITTNDGCLGSFVGSQLFTSDTCTAVDSCVGDHLLGVPAAPYTVIVGVQRPEGSSCQQFHLRARGI